MIEAGIHTGQHSAYEPHDVTTLHEPAWTAGRNQMPVIAAFVQPVIEVASTSATAV